MCNRKQLDKMLSQALFVIHDNASFVFVLKNAEYEYFTIHLFQRVAHHYEHIDMHARDDIASARQCAREIARDHIDAIEHA